MPNTGSRIPGEECLHAEGLDIEVDYDALGGWLLGSLPGVAVAFTRSVFPRTPRSAARVTESHEMLILACRPLLVRLAAGSPAAIRTAGLSCEVASVESTSSLYFRDLARCPFVEVYPGHWRTETRQVKKHKGRSEHSSLPVLPDYRDTVLRIRKREGNKMNAAQPTKQIRRSAMPLRSITSRLLHDYLRTLRMSMINFLVAGSDWRIKIE